MAGQGGSVSRHFTLYRAAYPGRIYPSWVGGNRPDGCAFATCHANSLVFEPADKLLWENISSNTFNFRVNMDNATSILLSLCIALGCDGAMAQQMYKTIGPDGKVTFSDRPKVEEKSRLSVMHAYTLRSVEPHQPASDPAGQSGKPVPKRDGARGDPASAVTPAIEDSIVKILGLSAFGGRFEIFCNGAETEARAFSAAALGWKQRNVEVVEHQKRVLTVVLSPVKRAELVAREEALLAEQFAKMSGRSTAARKEWCDGVIAELNSGRSDITHPALMAVAIVPYKAR